MKTHLSTALELIGIAAVVYGMYLWCVPAAFLVGGLALILLSIALPGGKR